MPPLLHRAAIIRYLLLLIQDEIQSRLLNMQQLMSVWPTDDESKQKIFKTSRVLHEKHEYVHW